MSTDTLRLRYTVRNESSNDIVILDINIPEKEYWNPLLINDKMEIEIDLGGNILAKMGMIRKFRILKSNTEYTAIFVLPVSQYLDKYKKWKEKMGFNWQSTFTKDVPIITSVAFSDSEEFLNGELRKATKFDDYWGMIEGWEGSGIESIVEMFKICGITLEIHLDDK